MSKESTINVINKSMYTLMEFSRKSRGPITGYRMRDLYILGFIFFDSKRSSGNDVGTCSAYEILLQLLPARSYQL